MKQKVDYGFDAPNVIRNLMLWGILCFVLAAVLYYFTDNFFTDSKPDIQWMLWVGWILLTAVSLVFVAVLMILSSKFGKIRERDRILDSLNIVGNERILDVGCGSGLYLIGAAKRLSRGQAIGIDIWQSEDLSGNRMENTLQNARLEGVADKIRVETADMRSMPFEDGSFDIILSSFAIHNLYDSLERKNVLREIARLLKVGGRLCIIDFRHIDEYIDFLKENSIVEIKRSRTRLIFPIGTVISGVKS